MTDRRHRTSERPDFDVVVVGGSAAGLRTAEALAQDGMRVAVFERREALGVPERTWIVTPHLESVLGYAPEPAVVHRTGVMELRAGAERTHVRLTPPDLILERAVLIPALGRRAEANGAEVHVAAGVQELRPVAVGFELSLSGPRAPRARVTARHVVAGDGVRSTVARLTGLPAPPAVPVLQARVRLPPDHDPDTTIVWFDRRSTPFFYWLIPESAEHGVAGLIAEGSSGSRRLLDDFLAEQRLVPESYQGALIPRYAPSTPPERRIDRARSLLVGDAAGHVKVTTVGGLVSGLWGAEAAARSLIDDVPYRAALKGLRRELVLHNRLRWFLDRFEQADYETLVRGINGRLRAVLGRYNRDSMDGAAWRLALAQPGLFALAARALLRRSGGGRRPDVLGSPAPADAVE